MNIASRRILRDTTHVVATNKTILESEGIYYIPNEEDSGKGTALLVGKPGTPYFGGYYFFSIEFPTDYPFSPLRVLTLTQDGHTRFNPNLYVQGKVCLSILNTWHDGPQWSGVQSLESVLLAIMSDVLNENPLQNEPAYKNCGLSPEAQTYNRLLWYVNLKIALIGNILNTPSFATEFLPIMMNEFKKNYSAILDLVAASHHLDGVLEYCRAFAFGHTYNFAEITKKLIEMKAANP
jgi:ubiquitin-conjugating enzyme E2 Z